MQTYSAAEQRFSNATESSEHKNTHPTLFQEQKSRKQSMKFSTSSLLTIMSATAAVVALSKASGRGIAFPDRGSQQASAVRDLTASSSQPTKVTTGNITSSRSLRESGHSTLGSSGSIKKQSGASDCCNCGGKCPGDCQISWCAICCY